MEIKVVPFSPTKKPHGPLDMDLGRAIGFGMTWKIQKTLSYSHFLHQELSHTKIHQRERKKKNIPSKIIKTIGIVPYIFPSFQVFFYIPQWSLGCLGFPSSAGPWFRISSCRAFHLSHQRSVAEQCFRDFWKKWKFSDSILEMCQNVQCRFSTQRFLQSACMLVSSLDLSLMECCGLSNIKHLPWESAHGRRKIGVFQFWQIPGDHHRYCHAPSFLFLSVPSIVRICSNRMRVWLQHVGFHVSGLEESKSQRNSCCLMVKWCQIPHVCWSIPQFFLVWPPSCGSQSISPSGHCLHLDMLRRYWLIRSWLERSRTN